MNKVFEEYIHIRVRILCVFTESKPSNLLKSKIPASGPTKPKRAQGPTIILSISGEERTTRAETNHYNYHPSLETLWALGHFLFDVSRSNVFLKRDSLVTYINPDEDGWKYSLGTKCKCWTFFDNKEAERKSFIDCPPLAVSCLQRGGGRRGQSF
jgi:hypothetical protein